MEAMLRTLVISTHSHREGVALNERTDLPSVEELVGPDTPRGCGDSADRTSIATTIAPSRVLSLDRPGMAFIRVSSRPETSSRAATDRLCPNRWRRVGLCSECDGRTVDGPLVQL